MASIHAELERRHENGGDGNERSLNTSQKRVVGKKASRKSSGPDYKKVRFIEKTKLQKKLNAVEKELLRAGHALRNASQVSPPLSDADLQALRETQAKLATELNSLVEDLTYVTHFPKDEKYISLFPPSPYTSAEVIAKQSELKAQVC